MAQQIINNGESGLTVRNKLNDNFTELYTGKDSVTVNTFADLPDPTTVTGQRYWVLTSTGVYLVNRRNKGAYYSDGIAWTWLGDNPTTADQIGNVPAGNITATDVQAALNELDTDIDALIGDIAALSTNVQIFTSSGTWTKPSGAKIVQVIAFGGGGGGGSGRKGAAGTARSGGGGASSAARFDWTLDASLLPSSVSVTVGAGGAGGAAVTANDTSGNDGSAGGTTTFGSYLRAMNGNGGGGGATANTGTVGGGFGLGQFSAANGGMTNVATGNGGGGAGQNTSSLLSATSGGAGGSITTANVAGTGGDGGPTWGYSGNFVRSTGAAANNSATSTTVPDSAAGIVASGAGGGGGGASTSGNAGNGAAGTKYGSGGGGGGAAVNSVGNSGAGGAGGDGICVVITHF